MNASMKQVHETRKHDRISAETPTLETVFEINIPRAFVTWVWNLIRQDRSVRRSRGAEARERRQGAVASNAAVHPATLELSTSRLTRVHAGQPTPQLSRTALIFGLTFIRDLCRSRNWIADESADVGAGNRRTRWRPARRVIDAGGLAVRKVARHGVAGMTEKRGRWRLCFR